MLHRALLQKSLPFLLSSIAAVLMCTVALYLSHIQALSLEFGNLYSKSAHRVTASNEDVMTSLEHLGTDARAFLQLDSAPQIRLVSAKDFRYLDIPFHDGEGFSGADGEALVGSQARCPTGYRRVGTLGVTDDSMLSNQVLLVDNRSFLSEDGSLILDGANAASRFEYLHPEAIVEQLSESQRSFGGTDVLSPLIRAVGALLIAILSISSGYIFGAERVPLLRTCDLLGLDPYRRGAVLISGYTLLNCATFGCIGAFLHFAGSPPRFLDGETVIVGTTAAVALATCTATAILLPRGRWHTG